MDRISEMKEEFLHYLWKGRLFNFMDLKTVEGEEVKIIFPGYHNSDAGPDFKQAVLQIDSMKWAGDVEIHIRSSDWYRHHHEVDDKYKSVILHVVYCYDRPVIRQKGETFPTLELSSYIPEGMFEKYLRLVDSLDVVSCRTYLPEMDSLHLQSLLSTVTMERLLRKQEVVKDSVKQCQGDWQEALYRQLAIGFGFKTNATAFELLARSLPYKIIVKHQDSQLQVSALVFGQAGFLNEEMPEDDYYSRLKYEYDYLRYKYQLIPVEVCRWNLLRLRPQNFPCQRLAQFAALLYAVPHLLEELVRFCSVENLQKLFSVSADTYWLTHYHFGKEKILQHSVQLGSSAIYLLIINTVIPFLFAYYCFRGEEHRLEKVVAMLEQIPFEHNKMSRIFEDTPLPRNSALDSQAQIELVQNYCLKKRCIECAIGDQIVRNIRNGV